jgi:hypothetical protein
VTDPPHIAAGHVVALRLFEVAYAIDLARAEASWAAHAKGRTARLRLSGTPPKAMAFGVPPVAVQLEPVGLDLAGRRCEAQATARLFDFGVVSLALRVLVADAAWGGFVDLMNAIDQAVGPGGAAERAAPPWSGLLQQLRRVLGPALVRPSASPLEEDYLLGVVHRFGQPLSAAELMDRVDLASLLSGEQRKLSDGARADLLRQRFSYYADDLVVLTWDRAFVYEPRGDSDVADVLEIANAQLLEMRYYDELLDDELPRMYDLVESTRRGLNVLAARRFATLARRLYTLVAEVTELTEKVDNALQVTEDVYLARIYAAALDLFRVRTVQAAEDRKLAIVRDTYAALYDEASSARSELLEITIVVLILVELVLAVWRH